MKGHTETSYGVDAVQGSQVGKLGMKSKKPVLT